jgi:hypothetical protein
VHAVSQRQANFSSEALDGCAAERPAILRHRSNTLADGLTYLGCSNRTARGYVLDPVPAGGMFVHDGSGAIGLYEDACGRPPGYGTANINPCDCRGSAVAVLKAAGAR